METDGDDLFENTDTEDGADDAVALIQANKKLIHFLTRQSASYYRVPSDSNRAVSHSRPGTHRSTTRRNT
jgi:hypothetical protein